MKPSKEQKLYDDYISTTPQERWKSKMAISALVSFIVFMVKQYTGYEIPQVDALIEIVLVILTIAGIYGNPKDKLKY